MENKDMPAFPPSHMPENASQIYTGVSKLEFFACNAPVDIPSWFVHVKPVNSVIEAPNLNDIQDEEERLMARDWLHDPIFDLPEHLQWFADKHKEASDRHSDYIRKDNAARYFQWRRYYAEQLLAELSKP